MESRSPRKPMQLKQQCETVSRILKTIDRMGDQMQSADLVKAIKSFDFGMLQSSDETNRRFAAVCSGILMQSLLCCITQESDKMSPQINKSDAVQTILPELKGPFLIKDPFIYMTFERPVSNYQHNQMLEATRRQQTGKQINLIYTYLVNRGENTAPLAIGLAKDRLFEILANPRLLDCLPDPATSLIAYNLRQGTKSLSIAYNFIPLEYSIWTSIRASEGLTKPTFTNQPMDCILEMESVFVPSSYINYSTEETEGVLNKLSPETTLHSQPIVKPNSRKIELKTSPKAGLKYCNLSTEISSPEKNIVKEGFKNIQRPQINWLSISSYDTLCSPTASDNRAPVIPEAMPDQDRNKRRTSLEFRITSVKIQEINSNSIKARKGFNIQTTPERQKSSGYREERLLKFLGQNAVNDVKIEKPKESSSKIKIQSKQIGDTRKRLLSLESDKERKIPTDLKPPLQEKNDKNSQEQAQANDQAGFTIKNKGFFQLRRKNPV